MAEPMKFTSAIAPLSLTLGWFNLVSFQRILLDFAASKHTSVMQTIQEERDMGPPNEPPPNASNVQYKTFEREERAYLKYLEARLSVCATMFQSCLLKRVAISRESERESQFVQTQRRSWKTLEVP
jgi:hypothetical protein